MQEPEEADAAEVLGLTGSTPDGVISLLQLPPLLPSVALFEAAERAAVEAPTSESQPLPEGTKPKPKFHRGPEMLKALPSGRVRSFSTPTHVEAELAAAAAFPCCCCFPGLLVRTTATVQHASRGGPELQGVIMTRKGLS